MIRPDATVWRWGYNTGTGQNDLFPVAVSGLSNAIAVAAGKSHVLVLKGDGSVWSMGVNNVGQLGDGTTTNRATPVQVSTLANIVAIAAGGDHSVALRNDGVVFAWGLNADGQLGDGTTTNRTSPVQTSTLSSVAVIAAGRTHTLAAKTDGSAWSWGNNGSGKLGDGTSTSRTAPVQVSGLSGVIALAGGTNHSLAVKSNGSVWAWGENSAGQLGDGTTTTRTTAVQTSTLTGATLVRAGLNFSLARKSDGSAWGWGTGSMLGLGGVGNQYNPVTITGLSAVVDLAASWLNGAAVLQNGSARLWGANGKGQIGDGTTTARSTPVWAIFYNAPDALISKSVYIGSGLHYAQSINYSAPANTYRIKFKTWGAGGGGTAAPFSQNLGGGGAYSAFEVSSFYIIGATLTPGRGLATGGEATMVGLTNFGATTGAGGGAGTAPDGAGGAGGIAVGGMGSPGLGGSGGAGGTLASAGADGVSDGSSPEGNPAYQTGGGGGMGYFPGGNGGSGTTQGGGGGGGGSSAVINNGTILTLTVLEQQSGSGNVPGGIDDPDYPGGNVGYGGSDGKGGNGAVVVLAYSRAAPSVTNALSATWTVGQPVSFQLTATNTLAHLSMTNIPPGLSLNQGTGVLSGTPTTANVYNSVITAEDAYGTGQANAVWTIVTASSDTVAPSVPAGFQFETLTDTSFRLMWHSTDDVGVTGYEVKRDGTLYDTVSTGSSIVSGGTAGLMYAMTVRARDAAGNWSAWSSNYNVLQGTIGAPTVPSGVNYADRTDTSITLIWSPSTGEPPVVGYTVYRGGVAIATVGDCVFTDTGLTSSTSYTYTVKALNAAGVLSAASTGFTVSTTNDTTSDSDHDGVPNAFEVILGTNPNAANPNDSTNQTQLKINQPAP